MQARLSLYRLSFLHGFLKGVAADVDSHPHPHTHLHPPRSVKTHAAMQPPAPSQRGNVSPVPAALTASLSTMVPHVGKPPMSVTSWSTALETPPSALRIFTGRMGASATTTSPSVSQGSAGVVTTSARLTLAQVCP